MSFCDVQRFSATLGRLSLAEKMALFSGSQKPFDDTQVKSEAPVLRRKNRRTESRFKTQVR